MKRYFFIIITLFVCAAILCGCESNQAQQEKPDTLPSRFVVIDDECLGYASSVQVCLDDVLHPSTYGDSTMKYVVDRETRVVYLFYNDRGMSLTPLYNADGSLMTYEGELPYSSEDEMR